MIIPFVFPVRELITANDGTLTPGRRHGCHLSKKILGYLSDAMEPYRRPHWVL